LQYCNSARLQQAPSFAARPSMWPAMLFRCCHKEGVVHTGWLRQAK